MRILVVGGGGREHAIIWKLKQSPLVDTIYCAPGNAGISQDAECVDIPVTDIRNLAQFAKRKKIGLTVAGPELPLALGIVDHFQALGLRIFGPQAAAARLEGSKKFAKDLMDRTHIPTAEYQVFADADKALRAVQTLKLPFVLKADGLAEGKGVLICHTRSEAYAGIEQIMKDKKFGEAGEILLIEEFLSGEEASVLAITDGEHMAVLPPAQDHKPIFEGDTGPNTGGMGSYAPAPVISDKLLELIKTRILQPVLMAMKADGHPYRGVLYAGLMITSEGPKVLEFNCRFGDPETQAILPLLETDLAELMIASSEGTLGSVKLRIKDGAAVCVVMASSGYPGSYEKGKPVEGLQALSGKTLVFHAGTKRKGKQVVTDGGRVLGITATGENIAAAIETVYREVKKVSFDGAYYRKDIGKKALRRE